MAELIKGDGVSTAVLKFLACFALSIMNSLYCAYVFLFGYNSFLASLGLPDLTFLQVVVCIGISQLIIGGAIYSSAKEVSVKEVILTRTFTIAYIHAFLHVCLLFTG